MTTYRTLEKVPNTLGELFFDYWGIYIEFEELCKAYIFQRIDSEVSNYRERWNFIAGLISRRKLEVLKITENKLEIDGSNVKLKENSDYTKDMSLMHLIRFSEDYGVIDNNIPDPTSNSRVEISFRDSIINLIRIRNNFAHSQKSDQQKLLQLFGPYKINNEGINKETVDEEDVEMYKQLYTINFWLEVFIEKMKSELDKRHH
ncbi:hypothetical protein JSY36_03385 [Bacillus sp. H-16]|uniref:hypothetical protein n=1 Tax=Alteribacter salitolerans TaxID=2912333 RepID=UPI0019659CB7|nr:hypothetical protein [Alteribacter salitolerans]MBM7094790.1 hypothetical protein [Alteribacter salitolerans]